MADKENAGRCKKQRVNPGDNTAPEQRVLQPRPDMEAPQGSDDVLIVEDDECEQKAHMSALGEWNNRNKNVNDKFSGLLISVVIASVAVVVGIVKFE